MTEPHKTETNSDYWKKKYDDLCTDLYSLFSNIEKTCYMDIIWIDGCIAGSCSVCGSIEWDYDPDDLWAYCHGCGSRIIGSDRKLN